MSEHDDPKPIIIGAEVNEVVFGTRPIMPKQRFSQIIKELRRSKFPFLVKVANDLPPLCEPPGNHREMPDWIDPSSSPLRVSYDKANYSYAEFGVQSSEDLTQRFMMLTSLDSKATIPKVEKVKISLHVGSPIALRHIGPAAEALFLAKEYITLVMALGMSQNFYDVAQTKGLCHFTDLDRNPLSPDKQRVNAGVAAFYNQTSQVGSDYSRILDILPAMFVATGLEFMVKNNSLPRSAQIIGRFNVAYNFIYSNQAVLNQVGGLINEWVDTNTLLPPARLLKEASSEPLASATLALSRVLWNR